MGVAVRNADFPDGCRRARGRDDNGAEILCLAGGYRDAGGGLGERGQDARVGDFPVAVVKVPAAPRPNAHKA